MTISTLSKYKSSAANISLAQTYINRKCFQVEIAKITYLPISDQDGVYNWPPNRL